MSTYYPRQRQPETAYEPGWAPFAAQSFAIKVLRAIYLSYAPREREHIRRQAERLAARYPQSYLARIIDDVYTCEGQRPMKVQV